jgi:hypothetical protein
MQRIGACEPPLIGAVIASLCEIQICLAIVLIAGEFLSHRIAAITIASASDSNTSKQLFAEGCFGDVVSFPPRGRDPHRALVFNDLCHPESSSGS